jgi:hypothetical protein
MPPTWNDLPDELINLIMKHRVLAMANDVQKGALRTVIPDVAKLTREQWQRLIHGAPKLRTRSHQTRTHKLS